MPNELEIYGKFILEELHKEYYYWVNVEVKDPNLCAWCDLRNMGPLYSIPCRHIMNDETMIDSNITHP